MSEKRVYELVDLLNFYREEYYNKSEPSVSDMVYDDLFDELSKLEKITGLYLPNSPTQSVGYEVENGFDMVMHSAPILSLEKTKSTDKVVDFIDSQDVLFMHKIDGITLIVEYKNGELISASTRGNGYEGRDVTNNVYNIIDVPIKIPYKKHLVVVGEGYVKTDDFYKMKDLFLDSKGKSYIDARNFASSCIQCKDEMICMKHGIRFAAFAIQEGLNEEAEIEKSKELKLNVLESFGFVVCDFISIQQVKTKENVDKYIKDLRISAQTKNIPVDGIVVTYNSIPYSVSQGRTLHHYNDSIAYKF